jgi:hypothetical protein
LRGAHLVAVFLRVEIERRLNLAVPQQALHRLGFHLAEGQGSPPVWQEIVRRSPLPGEGRGFMAMFA